MKKVITSFFNRILDFLGLTPEKKLENLKKKGESVQLLIFLDSQEETLREKSLEILEEFAYSNKLSEENDKQVLDSLDDRINIRQRIRIKSIDDPRVICRIGANEYIPQGNYNLAIFAFKAALELENSNILYLNNLARAYSLDGNQDEARQIWQKILNENPDEPTASILYSYSLKKQAEELWGQDRSNTEIERILLDSLKANIDDTEIYLFLAEYYRENGMNEKSLEYLKQSCLIGLLPDGYGSYSQLRGKVFKEIAIILKDMGEYPEAAKYCDYALSSFLNQDDEIMEIKELKKHILEKLK
jgi:tetratricopeptide (TPR) repeat protein